MTFKWYGERAKMQVFSKVESAITNMAADSVKQAIANASQTKGSDQHPQRQTGTLVRSITMDIIKEAQRVIAKVGIMRGKGEGDAALEYAEGLEFGTDRYPPYPYLFPAVELITKRVKEYFR